MTQRFILGLDPSLRGTGWCVYDPAAASIEALGVIVTKPPPASEKLSAQEKMTTSILEIHTALRDVIERYAPAAVFAEAAAGSKSVKAAASLAAAQAAVASTVFACLGAPPIYFSPQRLKKELAGRIDLSKPEMQAAVEQLFPETDWAGLFATPPPSAPPHWRAAPRSQRQNAYDAAACIHAAVTHPVTRALATR